MISQEKLNQLVLDIEFLIISVVQAVALGALASSATSIFEQSQMEYFPYILAGFLFVLLFWSGAIIHAISFIDWPLNLSHNFLYFLASFIEVIAFGQMTNPLRWFLVIIIFFAVAEVLYLVDYRLILKSRHKFEFGDKRKELYAHIKKRHLFEMSVLVPVGILFNLICLGLLNIYPQFFLISHGHLILITLQICFSLGLLSNSIWSFNQRSKLISKTIH